MQPTKLVTNLAVLLALNALVVVAIWVVARAVVTIAAVLR